MSKKINLHLDILGAGPAGLGVGYFAKKNKIPVSIYELSNRVGGNCKTIIKGDFRYDTGAHRLHDKHHYVTSEIKTLLGNELSKINVPSKIFHKGSLIDFPLNVTNLVENLCPQDLLKIGFENIMNIFKRSRGVTTFKQLAYQNYGKTLSELFLINYTQKLWGCSANILDPSISGSRLKNLTFTSLIKTLITDRSDSSHLDGSFFYPQYGFGTIFDKMSEFIGLGNIVLNSKITKLKHDGNKINEIQYNGKDFVEPGVVINTLPINILVDIFDPSPPAEVINTLNAIEFRDVRLCIIYLDVPKFSDNASIYFPESKFIFNRIYEPKNRSLMMAPKNKTCIVVETSNKRGEFSLSDKKYFKTIESSLIEEGLIRKSEIFDYEVGHIPNAYPVLKVGAYKKIKTALSYFSSFDNHILHGRNAEFKYIHTHDILSKSKAIIDNIAI
ncbi:MAG: hypothetical protein CMG55_10115 [Candidatus Marinimicrobia bacterium]|nr:hypothetical protein [Candidatus Neomarinimicrobiota bacterium]|tara:strand:- start:2410 stop:3738 length:1329 start_codon:yes stop_codon:yes gene_type:complete